ncbi:MAG: translation initiation factor IF-2 N-terminal domain-containing protein, partial [Bacillota bacterium]|nr:translation initiation factor IF-2 N-terminal domain-containing protein [Bacillota bacterium]
MSFENKYRVHEVAKDFGKQTKDITQILTTYATAPKNHMQVLSDKELSIVFEYMTQHNQVADMQASLATAPKGGENRGRNDRNDRGGDRNRNDRGDRNGQQGQRRDNRDGGRNDRNDRNDRNGRPGDRGPR